MIFDLQDMDGASRYRLLMSTVVPRPIAWLSTSDRDGRVNLAPFSCFNVMGSSPAMVAIGIQSHPDGRSKDSCANIRQTGEFVVNLVTRRDGDAMFMTAQDHEPDVDEAQLVGLATMPSARVVPPRIASAPCSLECRTFQIVQPGEALTIVLGEVLAVHVRDDLVLDARRPTLDTPGLGLIGRMEGPGWYTTCEGRLSIPGGDATV
ncbi:flavin reductase family protein [Sphingobium sp.]|uniref:flavin reductase family protein n=1 Tax=Sphingobium sp. TaxID=1912891 RepID=UPI0028BDB27E|nr:flavin reductase family protein [Sphingobium sp.]